MNEFRENIILFTNLIQLLETKQPRGLWMFYGTISTPVRHALWNICWKWKPQKQQSRSNWDELVEENKRKCQQSADTANRLVKLVWKCLLRWIYHMSDHVASAGFFTPTQCLAAFISDQTSFICPLFQQHGLYSNLGTKKCSQDTKYSRSVWVFLVLSTKSF